MAGTATRAPTLGAQIAALRYQPKYAALANALGEATQDYQQTVSQGKATAALTASAAKAALPSIQGAFGTAEAANARLAAPQLTSLPSTGVNDAFKGDMESEVHQQLARLLTARASAEAQNAQVAPQAAEGAQFNQLQARQNLATTVAKLFNQRSQIAGEEGADAATEEEKVLHESESNAQREAASLRSASTSRANSQESVGERALANKESVGEREAASQRTAAAKAGKGAYLPLASQSKAASTVRAIESEARAYWQKGVPREHIVQILSEGQPEESVPKRDAKGQIEINPTTGKQETEKVPARKAFAPDVLMSAALDSVEHSGSVTPQTLERLHTSGYSLKALSLAGPHPQKGASAPNPNSIAQAVLQALRG